MLQKLLVLGPTNLNFRKTPPKTWVILLFWPAYLFKVLQKRIIVPNVNKPDEIIAALMTNV